MMLDHDTRLSVAREQAERLRRTRPTPKPRDEPVRQDTARVYAFPKTRATVERGAAA